MSGFIEREVKLRVDSVEAARDAIVRCGGVIVRERRLQSDAILDSDDNNLRARGCALRVRVEPDRSFLTFKGPAQPSRLKLREELETAVGDPSVVFALLERLGYRVSFRYEKYREEYALEGVLVAVDETPAGTFLEIEGQEDGIVRVASMLGHDHEQYVVESYRTLFVRQCLARGVEPGDMLFPAGTVVR